MRFGHSKTSVTPVTHTQKQWCILSSFNNYKMRKFEEFTQNKSFRRLRCDGHTRTVDLRAPQLPKRTQSGRRNLLRTKHENVPKNKHFRGPFPSFRRYVFSALIFSPSFYLRSIWPPADPAGCYCGVRRDLARVFTNKRTRCFVRTFIFMHIFPV